MNLPTLTPEEAYYCRLITTQQAAELAGVTTHTILSWVRRDRLTPTARQHHGRALYFTTQAVDQAEAKTRKADHTGRTRHRT